MSVQHYEEPRCLECGSSLDTHAGFHVCKECGLTDSRHIATVPYEYTRGLPKDLGSDVGYSSDVPRANLWILRREQIRTRFKESNYYLALKRFEQVSLELNLTSANC